MKQNKMYHKLKKNQFWVEITMFGHFLSIFVVLLKFGAIKCHKISKLGKWGINKIHIAQNHKKTQTASKKLIFKKRKQLQRRILDIKDSTPIFIFYCFSVQARMTSKSTQKVLGN